MRFHRTLMETLAMGDRLPKQPAFEAEVITQNSFIARVKRTGLRTRQIGWVELYLLENDKLALCYLPEDDSERRELVFPLFGGSEFGECKRHGNTLTLFASRLSLILETDPAMAINNDNRGSLTGKWQRILGRLVSGEKSTGSKNTYFDGLGISVKQGPGPMSLPKSKASKTRSLVPQAPPVPLAVPVLDGNSRAKSTIIPSESLKRISLCLSKPVDGLSGLGSLGFGEDLKSVFDALDEKEKAEKAEKEMAEKEKERQEELSFDLPQAPFSATATEFDSDATTPSPSTLFLFPEGNDSQASLAKRTPDVGSERIEEMNMLATKDKAIVIPIKEVEEFKPDPKVVDKAGATTIANSESNGPKREVSKRLTLILEKEKEQDAIIHSGRQPPSMPPPAIAPSGPLESTEEPVSVKKKAKSVQISSDPAVIHTPYVDDDEGDDEFEEADLEDAIDEAQEVPVEKKDVEKKPETKTKATAPAPSTTQPVARNKTVKSPNLVKTMKKFLGKRSKKSTPAASTVASTSTTSKSSTTTGAASKKVTSGPTPVASAKAPAQCLLPFPVDTAFPLPSFPKAPAAVNSEPLPSTETFGTPAFEEKENIAPQQSKQTERGDGLVFDNSHRRLPKSQTLRSVASTASFCTATSTNNGRSTVEVPRFNSNNSITALSFRTLSSRSLSYNNLRDENLSNSRSSSASNFKHYEKNSVPKGWTPELDEVDDVDYFPGFTDVNQIDDTHSINDDNDDNEDDFYDVRNAITSAYRSDAKNSSSSTSLSSKLPTVTKRRSLRDEGLSPSLLRKESKDNLDEGANSKRMYNLSNKTAPVLHHSASSSYSSFASKNSLNSYTSLSSSGSFSTPALSSPVKQQDAIQRQSMLQHRQSMSSLLPTDNVNLFVGYLWISKWEGNRWNPLSQLELRTEVTAHEGASSEIVIHGASSKTIVKFTPQCEVRRISVHDTELRTVDDIYMFRSREPDTAQKLFKTLWSIQANGVRAVTSAMLASSLPSASSSNTLNRMSFYEDDEASLSRRKTLFPPTLSKTNLSSRYTGLSTSTILEE